MARIYLDMDGVVAKWSKVGPDTLMTPGYFAGIEPELSMVQATEMLSKKADLYILSSAFEGTESDKGVWLDNHMPFIPEDHRIFIPYGESKNDYAPVGKGGILIDDYNPNLQNWRRGTAIKFLNGINGGSHEWHGYTVSHDSAASVIAATICAIAREEGDFA